MIEKSPGMSGKETIKKLIFIEPEVKAIITSGYSNDPIMAHFKQYGFKKGLCLNHLMSKN